MVNITLEEIIRRKIYYCQNNVTEDMEAMNRGYICGYTEMLADMYLSEAEFISKYLSILNTLKKEFELIDTEKEPSDNIEQLSGYNNAIVEVLSLLDEKYLYAD